VNAPTLDRWLRVWRQIASKGRPESVYQELISRYSEPCRHYHNLHHIAECLGEFDLESHLASDPLAVELAIWFHDAIYDTHAPDNEERSAELARQQLGQAGRSAVLTESVVALVLATKSHLPSAHPDATLMIDVDLSIFGQRKERFQEYEAQIRREYDWVQESTFAARRAEILQRFLARERIYATEPFFAKFEKQARGNLEHSIQRLKASIHAG
jgi:predicted metal-dependent HD superfamily phosphohydrolase